MIIQYNNTTTVFEQLSKNKIEKEEYDRAVKYVLSDNYKILNFIKQKLWITEEQKKKAIHKALRYPMIAFELLNDSECLKLLNNNEIQVAIYVAIEDPHYAGKVLSNIHFINDKQRKEALEMVLLNGDYTIQVLTEKNTRKEDRLYLMQQIIDRNILIDKYFKIIADRGRNNVFNDEARKIAFKKLFLKSSSTILFHYAKKGFFYDEELEQIYNKYGKDYNEQYKIKFYSYWDFCRTFNKWLDKSYKERMARKIMTKSRWNMVNEICEDITFPQYIIDKFDSYRMAEKLRA